MTSGQGAKGQESVPGPGWPHTLAAEGLAADSLRTSRCLDLGRCPGHSESSAGCYQTSDSEALAEAPPGLPLAPEWLLLGLPPGASQARLPTLHAAHAW